jgi:hypothetical protein
LSEAAIVATIRHLKVSDEFEAAFGRLSGDAGVG